MTLLDVKNCFECFLFLSNIKNFVFYTYKNFSFLLNNDDEFKSNSESYKSCIFRFLSNTAKELIKYKVNKLHIITVINITFTISLY